MEDTFKDKCIQSIGQSVMTTKKIIGFVVGDNDEADVLISGLVNHFPTIRVIDRGLGPIGIWVRVGGVSHEVRPVSGAS